MRYPRLVHLLILLMITISAHNAAADTLFTNVDVFDGQSEQLLTSQNVLIVSNRIAKISARPIDAPSATIISGEDMTLMPELIDVHTHLALSDRNTKIEADFTLDYMGIRTAKVAERTLMEGFTSVRDLGGPVLGTQRAIDEGLIVGPRIFASGAFLSQTSGHGDFRTRNDRNPTLTGNRDSNFERLGVSIIAYGTTNVLAATRQNLMQGATQIKIMAGGGELLARSGPRNPAVGSLGLIEPGAMADILLVEGNSLEDLSVIGANPKWFDAPKPGPIDSIRLIMKDGVIYKNTL